ncbi:hypothetical protein GCM10010967_14740 [Dyadobacter beijingensis]|uniref:Thioredoxin domain-containing protein n=1 Tax=Dyadobacter beijingensis TaxID=365489 RepID=A0ABQ2HJV1_9BACT|nr:TlpA disulfide reductase family protein [Dyadobacter beijingensis]GGM83979.1 hypothetical protein GCM10010967_14740 [Dyadobacter beijingensis]
MKNVLLFVTFAILFVNKKSAAQQPSVKSPIDYYNQFTDFTNTKLNEDSALFNIRQLAANKMYAGMLKDVLHNNFGQTLVVRSFPPGTDSLKVNRFLRVQAFNKLLLSKIVSDTNQLLVHTARPMIFFSQFQDALDDDAKLTNSVNRFMQVELAGPDIYSNLSGRYGLMMHASLRSRAKLKPLSDKLFETIYHHLQSNLTSVSETSLSEASESNAWHKYLFAYANFVKAEDEQDLSKKKLFLKKAFDYSPNLKDQDIGSAYFYDMYLILKKEKVSFKEDYLAFLTQNSKDEDEVLNALLQIALQEPQFKEKLKAAYAKSKPRSDFGTYWMDHVNASAQAAPPISLAMVGKSRFEHKTGTGKWLLIDFWGTWCSPCREEHPELQKFYESTIQNNASKIDLMTIACRDTEARVTKYMAEKRFSFPVAMSDNKVELAYKVPHYPTKLLITPAGKYIVIPSDSDWISFVKHYTDL